MLCFNIIKISVFSEFMYNFSVIQNKVLISFSKGCDKVILNKRRNDSELKSVLPVFLLRPFVGFQ